MRGLSDNELMEIWDSGQGRPAYYRALLPLSRVFRTSIESLLDWPLGLRNGWLLCLRAWTLGPKLVAVGLCPSVDCKKPVEVEVAIQTLLDAWPEDWDALRGELVYEGETLILRPVTSRDVAEVSSRGLSPESVVRRCIIGPGRVERRGVGATGMGVPMTDLPGMEDPLTAVLADAEQALDQLDPLANIELGITCPDCQTTWTESLNVVEFVWEEIAVMARGVAREVHLLASAYGWSEQQIFGLSRTRRAMYLKLIDERSRSRQQSPKFR